MDFRHVKELIIPEGSVKELRIGGITVWRRPSANNYSVSITTDNTSAITGAKYKQAFSKTFTAEYNVPSTEQGSTPVWTVSGLPSGMSAESLNGDSLTVSGAPSVYGDFTLTVSVTKGSYTDSKQYTLTVEYVEYGVTITTSNASNITDFYQLKYASKTFSASFNVPPANANDAATWTFSGLPSGLSASGATVSGYADNTGTYTVTVKVTKAGYSDTKQYTFVVAAADVQLKITDSSLAAATGGSGYSATVATNASTLGLQLSSFVCTGGLPGGLSASVHSGNVKGLVSGTPSNITTTTYNPTFYAVAGAYKSPAKTIGMTSYSRAPIFNQDSATITLSAATIVSSSNVGKNVGSVTVTGNYFGETNSVEVMNWYYSSGTNTSNSLYHFSFDGYSGSGAICCTSTGQVYTTPSFTMSVTLGNNLYKGASYTHYMSISLNLRTRYSGAQSSLKNRTNSFLIIRLHRDGGSSDFHLNILYN